MSKKTDGAYTVKGCASALHIIRQRMSKMERNQNGYPTPRVGGDCTENGEASLGGKLLAYAYVPMQSWRMLYSVDDALGRGTLFEELDKPMGVYGNE